jgi:hypothetical protein
MKLNAQRGILTLIEMDTSTVQGQRGGSKVLDLLSDSLARILLLLLSLFSSGVFPWLVLRIARMEL